MYKRKTERAKKLKVKFDDVRYGLMFFTLTLGGKSYQTNFSDVFDPLISFKKWLEAISIGVDQCSFWYDPEGDEIKFNFEQRSWDRDVFTVSYYFDNSEPFLTGKVERKQLVEAFYLGLLNFYETSDLIQKNWEKEYLWERFLKITKMDYETVINILANMPRKKLKETLFKADPQYLVSYPSADENEAFGYYVDYVFGKETPAEHPIVRTPIEWKIPKNYNQKTLEKKKEFIRKCLSYKTAGAEGTKIADFKSQIIEDFLNEPKMQGCLC